MGIKDQLKESDCPLCHTARDEIIRLEAEVASNNKWLDRLSRRRVLRGLAPKTAAGRARIELDDDRIRYFLRDLHA